MQEMFFEDLDSFIPLAVGEPGSRVFLIQARAGETVAQFKMEKEQVGMLGGYLGSILAAIGSPEPDRDIAGLIEPVSPRWAVGSISVGLDETDGLIAVTVEEFLPDEDDDPSAADEPRSARFHIRGEQAAAFAEAAAELMSAGRPPCRLCGAPMDPAGHACPRWN